MKNKLITIMAVIIMVLSSSYGNYEVVKAYDETDTDVIHNYEITVDVNDDATINIKYHIEWEVLESDENGPVEWVQIGIPNDDVISYEALSDNIDYIEIEEEGGSFADIYFDGEYYEDDVISFDFVIVQDSMYMVEQEGIDYNNSEDYDDRDKEGATDVMTEEAQGEESNMTEDFKNLEGKVTYFFTPGWFDEIEVEKLTIRWNSEKVMNSFPNSKNKDGYLVWKTALSYGEQYDIRIVYDINAYEFDLSFTSYPNQYDSDYDDDYYDNNYYEKNDDSFSVIVGVLFSTIIFIGVFAFRVFMGIADYRIDSGFGSTTKTKITRQKITYYENCPNCGGTRAEGKDECAYCGTNMIKTKEIIDETNVSNDDKDALLYRTEGIYQYGNDKNKFVRVHVVNVPVSRKHSGSGNNHHHHSSCVHSSCACACASSCACACACAGGGRAGCSSKDFYRNSPKLELLKKKMKE